MNTFYSSYNQSKNDGGSISEEEKSNLQKRSSIDEDFFKNTENSNNFNQAFDSNHTMKSFGIYAKSISNCQRINKEADIEERKKYDKDQPNPLKQKEKKQPIQQLQKWDKEFASRNKPFTVISEQKLGSGFHGDVFQVKDVSGKVQAAKRYSKSKTDSERTFIRESSILATLQQRGRKLGISQIFQSDGDSYIVMKKAIGTLQDFINFQKDQGVELVEGLLLSVLYSILQNYEDIRDLGIVHRDIKPGNILLHKENLRLEIIDFGFAVFLKDGDTVKDVPGTRGYIHPNLVQKQNLNLPIEEADLFFGDCFAIAIVMLKLADPNFIPIQECLEEKVREALKKMKHKTLRKTLNILLFSRDKNKINSLEKYLGPMKIPINQRRECLGLKLYRDSFKQYQLSKFKPELSTSKETKMYLNYYEKIIKDKLLKRTVTDPLKYCEKILGILDKNASITPHPLLYSSLGICFFEKADFEKAAKMFNCGLKIAENCLDKLILLNNHGCLQFKYFENKINQNNDNSLRKAYRMIGEEILLTIDGTMNQWLNFNFSEPSLACVEPNSSILISLIDIQALIQEPEELFITVFFNFCISLTLPLDNILGQSAKFVQYISTLNNNIDNKTIKFPGYLEAFIYLYEFTEILMEIPDTGKSPEEIDYLGTLKKESKLLIERREDFFNLFKEETMFPFTELKGFEIFFIMIGLVLRFRKKEPHISFAEMSKRKNDLLSKYSDSFQLIIVERADDTKKFSKYFLYKLKVSSEGSVYKSLSSDLDSSNDGMCFCELYFLDLQGCETIPKEATKNSHLCLNGKIKRNLQIKFNLFGFLDSLTNFNVKIVLLMLEIGDEFLKNFIDFIDKNKQLKKLHFQFFQCPQISDESVESLVKAISHNHSLTDLSVSFRFCANVSISKMTSYKSFLREKLPLLKKLNVSHNVSLELTGLIP